MDNVQHLPGEHSISCAEFSVRANVANASTDPKFPMTGRIDLAAVGPVSDGCVNLSSNGRIAAKVDRCSMDIVSGGVVLDGGDLGKVGLRAGTAPMMQQVDLDGNGGSIVVQNGQLPICPKIEVSPDSIVLSVGPNKITINALGIQISGLQVAVKGTVDASLDAPMVTVKGDVQASLQGAMVAVEGSAMTTVKGGIVMIN
jgi:type VI secretion system secreted protein VgrG